MSTKNTGYLLIGCLFFFTAMQAQLKGKVVDSLSGAPLPWVSIWAVKEAVGTTTEADGTYEIPSRFADKKWVFSSVGYAKKTMVLKPNATVRLAKQAEELSEVVIVPMRHSKQEEIGNERGIHQAFDNGPKMDIRFFPYLTDYKKTRYLNRISLLTDSKIDSATVKIHLYAADQNGHPGKELNPQELILMVKKGVFKNRLTVSDFAIPFPETGLFVAVEKMMVRSNQWVRERFDPNSKQNITLIEYHPFVLYNRVDKERSWLYVGGEWQPQLPKEGDSVRSFYEPEITVYLTN